MVFSQTSQKTPSILKVVELNRLKPEKNQKANGATGVVTIVDTQPGPSQPVSPAESLPVSTSNCMEEFLKLEPEQFETMYQSSDCEFFQDLGLWCSDPAKEEQVLTIDSLTADTKSNNTDTLYTVSSPVEQASPVSADGFFNHDGHFYPDLNKQTHFQEQFLDIASLPVVIGDEGPAVADYWAHTHNTDYTETYTDTLLKTPFIDQEDSMDLKTVPLEKLEWRKSERPKLRLDVAAPAWPDLAITTPDVLSYVEQLEKEKSYPIEHNLSSEWPTTEDTTMFASTETSKANSPAHLDYEPITPKTESHIESDDDIKSVTSRKRRRDSEDSDETYRPEKTSSKKYRRRKPSVPIQDMIQALEESRPATKARRGRPPKRRDSNVSSICSAGPSSTPDKYREVRDKNNEASKRSRMNRKLKELQMEQLALDLEERNKRLQVRADVLEDMTKRLKAALMTAILKP
ncbi:hypothetical protein JYU34_004474 [Plutella xylostella]|uniref:BZIP domain-containing protein n=1 Tax=Plutella xylostella TaxID=51655 RepID=A0ABQ7QY80_PLUXY|nr:hypothetical protein JYU34_004474 [Plutella xylostella]